MKAFYTTLCLFVILLGAISVNYFYIIHLSKSMIDQLEQLPLPTEDSDTFFRAEQLRDRWHSCQKIVQITVNHAEVEAIENAVDELCVFAKHQSPAEFERAKSILINVLEELELSEKLSPTNIL